MILKIQKSWQTGDPKLVLQVTARVSGFPKKAYLIIDTRQLHFGVTLSQTKPESTTPQAAFINLFRKYCRTAVISDIIENAANGDIWLVLHNSPKDEPDWYLLLAKARPPELALVSQSGEDFVRTGTKGSFTKKKSFSGEVPRPEAHFRSIMSDMVLDFAAMAAKPAAAEVEEPEEKVQGHEFSPPQRDLLSKLKRKLKTLAKAYEKAMSQIPSPLDLSAATRVAGLLQQYAYLIVPEADAITLSPDQTGDGDEPLVIPLDPNASPGQNIEHAFIRLKKLRRALDNGKRYAAQIEGEVHELKANLERLRLQPLSNADLDALRFRYKISMSSEAPKERPHERAASVPKSYRTYLAVSGQRLLVGRGASENDELTKASRSNDWWFHAVGVTGSHIVVPMDASLHGGLPEGVKRAAAILALHHSTVKNDLRGEVYVTQVRHLKKQRGMPPGLWQILRSETLFLSYSKEDADEILMRLKV